MPTGALIGGATLLSGALGASASKSAAKKQAASADAAVEEQRRQFDVTREDLTPWMRSGRNALASLDRVAAGDRGDFLESPDYNFRRTEGLRGIERTAAARGGALSGNTLIDLGERNSNLAKGEFGDWWNRTASRAGVGQTAAAQLGQFGAQTAGNIGTALMAGGDARAAGRIGQANAVTGAIGNATDWWLYSRRPPAAGSQRVSGY